MREPESVLELCFQQRECLVLARTRFLGANANQDVIRDRGEEKSVFPERPGPYSLAWTFVQFALAGGDAGTEDREFVRVPADAGSPASTLKDSLRTGVQWRDAIFGTDFSIKDLLLPEKSEILLVRAQLEPANIRVHLEDVRIAEADELQELAAQLALQWQKRRGAGRKPDPEPPERAITDEECLLAMELAVDSIRVPPERVSLDAKLIIGLARRIQLAAGLEGQLGKIEHLLDLVYTEAFRDPMDPRQIYSRIHDFLIGFAECAKVIFNQGQHWTPLNDIAEEVGKIIEDRYIELQEAFRICSSIPDPDEVESQLDAIWQVVREAGSDEATESLKAVRDRLCGSLALARDVISQAREQKLRTSLGAIRDIARKVKEDVIRSRRKAAALVESAKGRLESVCAQLECEWGTK